MANVEYKNVWAPAVVKIECDTAGIYRVWKSGHLMGGYEIEDVAEQAALRMERNMYPLPPTYDPDVLRLRDDIEHIMRAAMRPEELAQLPEILRRVDSSTYPRMRELALKLKTDTDLDAINLVRRVREIGL